MLDIEKHSISRWPKVALFAALVGGLVAFFVFDGQQWLDLDALKAHRDELLAYTAQHYWAALFSALLIYAGAVALSVPGATILSLALGMLFGRWVGTLLIMIAATVGATGVFFAARYLFADAARRRLGARMNNLLDRFRENAFSYLLFLRLVPLFPFWLVNLASAFTPVSARVYVAATAVGIIPGAFVFANVGASLGRIHSTRELFSFDIVVALTLLGMFSLLPIVVKKLRDSDKSPGARHGEHDA